MLARYKHKQLNITIMNRYTITIHHSEWSHSTGLDFSSKKEAMKEASKIRNYGRFFTDDLRRSEVEECTIEVYDTKNQESVNHISFAKKYIKRLKK